MQPITRDVNYERFGESAGGWGRGARASLHLPRALRGSLFRLTAYIHADAVTATMKARAPAAKVSRVCIAPSRSSSPLQGLGLDDVISTWFNVIESGCVRTPLPFPSCPHRDVTLRAFWAMPPTPSR